MFFGSHTRIRGRSTQPTKCHILVALGMLPPRKCSLAARHAFAVAPPNLQMPYSCRFGYVNHTLFFFSKTFFGSQTRIRGRSTQVTNAIFLSLWVCFPLGNFRLPDKHSQSLHPIYKCPILVALCMWVIHTFFFPQNILRQQHTHSWWLHPTYKMSYSCRVGYASPSEIFFGCQTRIRSRCTPHINALCFSFGICESYLFC